MVKLVDKYEMGGACTKCIQIPPRPRNFFKLCKRWPHLVIDNISCPLKRDKHNFCFRYILLLYAYLKNILNSFFSPAVLDVSRLCVQV